MEIKQIPEAENVDVPKIIVTDDGVDTNVKRRLKCINKNKSSMLYRCSSHIIRWIEWLCGFWGYLVASNPWKAIFISIFLAGLSGCGLYYVKFEFRPYKLWVKEPSEFNEVHEWKMKNFPNTIRKHIAIIEMENVLTANSIKRMWDLHLTVRKSPSAKNRVKFEDVCLRVPSLVSQMPDLANNYDDYSTYSYDYPDNTDMPDWLSYDYPETTDMPDWLSQESQPIKNEKVRRKRSTNLQTTSLIQESTTETVVVEYETNYELNSEIPIEKRDEENSLYAKLIRKSESDSPYLSNENASIAERKEHCKFVEELELICYEESLLEVWGYNEATIQSLTNDKVLKDINEFKNSRVTGFPIDIASYLGEVKRDRNGSIYSARGALYTWYTQVNLTEIRNCEKTGCKIEIDLGSGEDVDVKGMEWEITLTEIVNGFKMSGMPINLQASYLFGAVHRMALFQDSVWVAIGWLLLVLYVVFTLGKPFSENSRIIPILIGILCVGLSVLASYGLCTLSGIPYGPLNSVLPILLIALGVDDMYVICHAWDSVSVQEVDTKNKMKTTLNKAGLAITVTTLTDVIAFIVGATTKVPALRYFCVYAAVGITIVYVLQITLFVAAVVLNDRRKKSNKGCPLFLQCNRPTSDEVENSKISIILGKWAKFILKPAVTGFILIFSGFMFGLACHQMVNLQQKFESVWLLPESSEIYRWFRKMDEIFPKDGRQGFIFFENVTLPDELPELEKLTANLRENKFMSRVDAWFEELLKFMSKEDSFKNKPLSKAIFDDALTYFLFNEDGAKYRNDIVFDNKTELHCNQIAPSYHTFKINFQYKRLEDGNIEQAQEAMTSVREIVSKAKLSGYRAPWALSYGQWETDNFISVELIRNVLVVLVIVFVMTMVLLASLRSALLVLVCVLTTLVDVAALMSVWGLTINTVSCIALIIAIGICVDYAAHITHGFLTAQGTRKFRAKFALKHMGPAVLNGGFSTLIAFLLLGPADTFVYISYFKILTGVAVFGLYHALVLLPILLALLGPPPYSTSENTLKLPDDLRSCSTEASTITASNASPTITPPHSSPNSPSHIRNELRCYENSSDENDKSQQIQKEVNQKFLAPILLSEDIADSFIGNQCLKNIVLPISRHKSIKPISQKREDNKRNFTDAPLPKNSPTLPKSIKKDKKFCVEKPEINQDNIHKIYIKNS